MTQDAGRVVVKKAVLRPGNRMTATVKAVELMREKTISAAASWESEESTCPAVEIAQRRILAREIESLSMTNGLVASDF